MDCHYHIAQPLYLSVASNCKYVLKLLKPRELTVKVTMKKHRERTLVTDFDVETGCWGGLYDTKASFRSVGHQSWICFPENKGTRILRHDTI